MAKPEEIDDLDALIDKAVDTFFVEAPDEDEQRFLAEDPAPISPEPPAGRRAGTGPSLDEAMDSLFSSSFQEALDDRVQPPASVVVTSGDDEIDQAIDFAVDTLFIEEPDTAPPETTQLDVSAAEIALIDEPVPEPPVVAEPVRPRPVKVPPPAPARPPVEQHKAPATRASYDDAMAQEIERHMRSIYTEPATPPQVPVRPAARSQASGVAPVPPAARRPQAPPPSAPRVAEVKAPPPAPIARRSPVREAPVPGQSPMRKLQEAILTLEWEISKRSIAVLTAELKQLRIKFRDDVAVDFAVVAMKLVLEYLAQRMSRAHPESIRFLLEVTDLLERSVGSSSGDPLGIFHRILTRYETFKSVVRKAEGLPDRDAPVLQDLAIDDPQSFAKLVEAQALMLIRASRSLARAIGRSKDPKNLIRSFRFLVNRSVNRILENTHKGRETANQDPRKKGSRTSPALR
jgi:hypothetical protein